MSRLEELRKKINEVYESKNPNRATWADWLYQNHVFVVGDYAEKLAKRYGADAELASAAGLLHDVADAVMKREDSSHEEQSFQMARNLLDATGFTEEEIKVVVDDAIRFHGCHGEQAPVSIEGKVMAAADALAHLSTNFYDYAIEQFKKEGETVEEIKSWGLPKIERDYKKKISFADLREEASVDYERVKSLFNSV